MNDDPTRWYDRHVQDASACYEALPFEEVHGWLLPQLPPPNGALALDVGAGSGRDAAWLADRGFDVVAVEPSAAMRTQARLRHSSPRIRWIDDRLPALAGVTRLGTTFDLILLSAVWMHVPPTQRHRAFRKLINLLKPGGVLAVTLRHGPAEPERVMYEVDRSEIERLARGHGAIVEAVDSSADRSQREKVSWEQIAIRLPDDGTGALPLLRHIILNDAKSSTYKLALLRTLCRIADGADGLCRDAGDDQVSLPLGQVSLTWLRLFHPLLRTGLPQAPHRSGTRGLSFVRDETRELLTLPAFDLRAGMRWSGSAARSLHRALRLARDTVVDQPARYITYPSGNRVLEPAPRRPGRVGANVLLDEPYLRSFGELLVPRDLWHAMQRFTVWVEPAIVSEWQRLMREYARAQRLSLNEAEMAEATVWPEPSRAVRTSRERAVEMLGQDGGLRCVWSGQKLTERNLDIDHCFAWTVWPCGDLWNLLPVHRDVNRRKGARLPDAATLQRAGDAIVGWWEKGYLESPNPMIPERFAREASATLPTLGASSDPSPGDILEAMQLRRVRLKHDQQVPEWASGGG